MKTISAVMITGILFILTIFKGHAQETVAAKTTFIPPYHLDVTYNKTTNLVFPYAITSVDRGSKDILVQKAIGVENVLQIKAAKMGFAETNLTVLTADGSLYAYLLDYSISPANLSYVFSNPGISWKPVAVFAKDATTDEIKEKADLIVGKERTVDRISNESFGMTIDVKGIYVHGEVIYFQLLLKNKSTVNYDVQALRFHIQDKKQIKRTAEQEVDMQPLYIAGNVTAIPGLSNKMITVALSRFTIPDKKYLSVDLMEKNGGRHLHLRIKNKSLIRATAL